MIIALLGLPGVGKSTLAKALAEVMGGTALVEPEETDWPEFVRHPHEDGAFTALTWFRSQRVPLYFRARSLSRGGETAVLDSYYDKWCVGWLGRRGLEWLIDPSDPYFAAAMAMAETDSEVLPRADVVVVLTIAEALWRRQVTERSRTIDQAPEFLESYESQQHFVSTAMERGARDGTEVIMHERRDIAAVEEARLVARLISQLRLD